MNQLQPEDRRTSTRFRIQAPGIATIGGREIWVFAKDMSTCAVYLRTAGEGENPPIGAPVDFLIKIPPSLTYSKPCFIKGRGRTIRLDHLGGEEMGVVVEILEYSIDSELLH